MCALLGCTARSQKGGQEMIETQWGVATEDLAISISVSQADFRPCDTVEMHLILKNVGDGKVPIVQRSPWIDYAVTVRRGDASEVPKTPYALQMIDAAAYGRRATGELAPGETLAEPLELSKAFDLSAPGVYTVVAKREVYKKGRLDQYATVTSNELTMRVTDTKE
jgi:hypothetical protein